MNKTSEIVKRQAEIVRDARGKIRSSRIGTYSNAITVELALKKKGQILTIADISKVQYGRANIREDYVRRMIPKAVSTLLTDGTPAITIYDEEKGAHHRKKGLKVIIEFSQEDMDALQRDAYSAQKRGDLSAERAKRVLAAMDVLRKLRDS